ncbi:MAG: hypothetical protein UX99_C0014G0005 [Candidatus Amesbacteria bacterium GW2011_GWB1_47_26]|uniref:Uncharacterized protein n=1 Tax=Candidatus Amesbacteria bacterium GW2011_GWC2_45_19 TaxID=1618366 RepID=A0A0G1PBK9_9BACT|nr:MAG: hypothetical protein UX05_C0007G0022 [Candidatus Amesbacteria bacterium GW2011_GWC2_45_19]KKU37284.1 MAG: hypothetical protein UX52_C0030G0015 [Candidatus Amesbacteria bacterium GW2011_GWA1_46_35]KKU68373.1 MAG: hypothetical protein UX93_C0008G0022 [Microgenomates group bacterium GW2011_GWC1_47_20]KKU74447.1 MAG: hypothetical protein UX99_C0014G0005 [Candidatus Amesbacteria bacterium GW2011_GWB1_47_26]KKU79538.1 MAG: hypothetical protein UY06_C0019G0008 [Candidatus Amesbacteria bacteriu
MSSLIERVQLTIKDIGERLFIRSFESRPKRSPSLNCSLNKGKCRGTHYLRNCYLEGEDRLKIEKDLLAPRNSVTQVSEGDVRAVEISGRDEFVGSKARTGLERMINEEGYQVTKLVRKDDGSSYFLQLERG